MPASALQWTELPTYRATVLNAPHNLTTVRQNQAIELITATGLPHPLQITPQYAQERGQWCITPCCGCGADQTLDPMTTMAKTRFPGAPGDSIPIDDARDGRWPACACAEVARRREALVEVLVSTRWKSPCSRAR